MSGLSTGAAQGKSMKSKHWSAVNKFMFVRKGHHQVKVPLMSAGKTGWNDFGYSSSPCMAGRPSQALQPWTRLQYFSSRIIPRESKNFSQCWIWKSASSVAVSTKSCSTFHFWVTFLYFGDAAMRTQYFTRAASQLNHTLRSYREKILLF